MAVSFWTFSRHPCVCVHVVRLFKQRLSFITMLRPVYLPTCMCAYCSCQGRNTKHFPCVWGVLTVLEVPDTACIPDTLPRQHSIELKLFSTPSCSDLTRHWVDFSPSRGDGDLIEVRYCYGAFSSFNSNLSVHNWAFSPISSKRQRTFWAQFLRLADKTMKDKSIAE